MRSLTPGSGILHTMQMSDRSRGSDDEAFSPSAMDTLKGIIVPERPNESMSPEIQANAITLFGRLLRGEGREVLDLRMTLRDAVIQATESGRPIALGAEALVR